MLSILMVLAAVPQTTIAVRPDHLDLPARPQGGATMPVLGSPPPGCESTVTRVTDPTAPGGTLMWRERGQAVGLYRLLDRYVDGCSAPIVVNYRVPGSNALGRETGRDPGPLPRVTPRP
jgi:hypothetical protein